MTQLYVIAGLIFIIVLFTISTTVIALLGFRSLGYGSAATNIAIGLSLSAVGWFGIGIGTQSWIFEDRDIRLNIIVIGLIIKGLSLVYEWVGFWRLYIVSKGWWL